MDWNDSCLHVYQFIVDVESSSLEPHVDLLHSIIIPKNTSISRNSGLL